MMPTILANLLIAVVVVVVVTLAALLAYDALAPLISATANA